MVLEYETESLKGKRPPSSLFSRTIPALNMENHFPDSKTQDNSVGRKEKQRLEKDQQITTFNKKN